MYVTDDAPLLVAPAAGVLAGHGATLADVKLGIPTLEDDFIDLTWAGRSDDRDGRRTAEARVRAVSSSPPSSSATST